MGIDYWYDSAGTPTRHFTTSSASVSADRTRLVVEDDFLNGQAFTTATGGSLGWVRPAGAGTVVAGVAGHPGIVQIQTTATITTLAYYTLSGAAATGILSPADAFDVTWIFRLGQSDTDTQFRLGVMVNAGSAQPADGFYVEKLYADTNLFMVNRASGTQTRTDTTVAGDTAWHRFRARRIDASNVGLSFDGVETVVSTNIPSAPINPALQIVNQTAVNKTIDLDYFSLTLTGLSR
jgi:hypothetical protein